jgi:hypothetical protein
MTGLLMNEDSTISEGSWERSETGARDVSDTAASLEVKTKDKYGRKVK